MLVRIISRMKKNISVFTLILLVFALFSAGCRKGEKPPEPLTDINGNIYNTVKIGTRIWMAENLKVTRYNDGTEIPLTKDAAIWRNLVTGAYCWYNNDETSFKDTYGALYNGYTIDDGKLCPVGWHVPEAGDWKELREFLGDSAKAGGKLKEAGTAHWLAPNKGADNSSGFTALGAGIRYFEGTYASILSYSSIWSSTEVSHADEWCCGFYFAEAALTLDHRNKKYGFSVRCLKD